MKIILILLALHCSFLCDAQNENISTKDSLKAFTYKLINKALAKKKFKKLAIWDFTDLHKNSSSIATYVADQLSIYAAEFDSVIVLDRQNIETILREHKLQDKDLLIDPKALLKLGEFFGTEVLIVGKVSIFEGECAIQLNLKIVDVNTAHVITAAEGYIPVDKRFADVSGLRLNCQGMSTDVPGKPGRGYGRSPETNEDYNNPQKLKEGGCAEYNTGAYCFFNSTTQNLKVVIFKTPEKTAEQTEEWRHGPKDEFILKPEEVKCIYSLIGGNSYKFIVQLNNTDNQNNGDYFDSGNILIEKCNSKTYKIKNAVTTETKKVTDKLFKDLMKGILQRGTELLKEKMKVNDN